MLQRDPAPRTPNCGFSKEMYDHLVNLADLICAIMGIAILIAPIVLA
jgi:hypothetical protein